ncbi:MAG: N-formylglutamate amidohydrolase, partial [Proteobacteria bacterium]|nr:N-formylglutamate amidohydrolase [Pseudomonadota bacterium]
MAEPLLQLGDPAPFRVINADGRAPLLLVCD